MQPGQRGAIAQRGQPERHEQAEDYRDAGPRAQSAPAGDRHDHDGEQQGQ